MKKINIFKKYGSTVIIAFICLIVIPIYLLIGFNYSNVNNIIKENATSVNGNILNQYRQNVEETILRINTIANIMRNDEKIISGERHELTETQNIVKFSKYLDEMKMFASINCEITVLYADKDLYTTLPASSLDSAAVLSSDWYKSVVSSQKFYKWSILSEDFVQTDRNDWVVLTWLVKEKKGLDASSMLIFSIKPEDLLPQPKNEDEILMLVSENGTVISNVSISEKNELARYTSVEGLAVNINNQKFIVDAQKINYTNWHIVRAYDYSKYIEEAHRQKLQSFMIPAVCITFFVMLILYVIHKTNKPIHKLIKAANRVSEKDFSVRLPKNRMGELEIVYSVFNSMLDTFESLLQENERKQNSLLKEQKKKNDYKFKMLQSQINPHFLLNVLNNIKWMALINKADNVADMLMALGNLLNASMGKTADEVIIEEELQYVNDYVKLQKMRYGDSFNISMEIDPEIKQFFVIKLLLQPIVENAIIHGCVIANRYGYIQIIGKEEDGDIVFLVRDNGTGMTKEEIEKLSQPETEQNNSSQHIGLYGTNDRIKLYYGSSYGISVVSDEKGTTVKIRIPKRLYQSDNVDK